MSAPATTTTTTPPPPAAGSGGGGQQPPQVGLTAISSTRSFESTISRSSSTSPTNSTSGATTTMMAGTKRPLAAASMTQQQQQQSAAAAAAAAAAASRTGKNGEPLSEKKLRRLEKNRLSARECRRRKREATEHMERQINCLEGENLRLRLQLQIGEEAEATNRQEQKRLTEALDDLLKSGASESEIYAKIEEYKEKFADYGRDRRSAVEFHLRNIERLLMPTQTTSVLMTTLHMGEQNQQQQQQQQQQQHQSQNQQSSSSTTLPDTSTSSQAPAQAGESQAKTPVDPTTPSSEVAPPPVSSSAMTTAVTSDAGANGGSTSTSLSTKNAKDDNDDDIKATLNAKSLFQQLVHILEVTPEQATALKDSRFVAKEMDDCLKASLNVLEELRRRLTQCGSDLENEFNNVRSILTPTQAAKFLVWVANNKACMHMLNELWNRVYPSEGGATVNNSTTTTHTSATMPTATVTTNNHDHNMLGPHGGDDSGDSTP